MRMVLWNSGLVLAQLDSSEVDGPLLLEQTSNFDKEGHDELLQGETLVCKDASGFFNVLLNNPTGTSHKIEAGTLLGCACEVELVESMANSRKSLVPAACNSNTSLPPHPIDFTQSTLQLL